MTDWDIRLLNPPCALTANLARILLRSLGKIEVECQGFAWWPRPAHGDHLTLERFDITLGSEPLHTGELVLVEAERGRVDLLRVLRCKHGAGQVGVALDTDPNSRRKISLEEILARSTPREEWGPLKVHLFSIASRLGASLAFIRQVRGIALDKDPAKTVLCKYDFQAKDYLELDLTLPAFLRQTFEACAPNSVVLVGGCGTGPDLISLKKLGLKPVGCDFSIEMLRAAQSRPELCDVSMVATDLRSPCFRPASFDLIYLTPDVYNFVPGRRARIQMMKKLLDLLKPGGHLILTAREFSGKLEVLRCLIYLVTRLRRHEVAAEWGDWFTTYFTLDGRLRFSFVHLFSQDSIEEELKQAARGGARRVEGFWVVAA